MERKLPVIVDDGVPGIASALKADDNVRLGGEHIGNLAFPFVAPVGSNNRFDHVSSLHPKIRRLPPGEGAPGNR